MSGRGRLSARVGSGRDGRYSGDFSHSIKVNERVILCVSCESDYCNV